MIPRFRVWNGKQLHSVVALVWEKGGLRWYGSVGRGYITVNDEFTDWESVGGKPARLDELMQWTGLTDRNGVRIYEDDVIEMAKEGDEIVTVIGRVVFRLGHEHANSTHMAVWVEDKDGLTNPLNDMGVPRWINHEVLGNVHENPTLLEGKT